MSAADRDPYDPGAAAAEQARYRTEHSDAEIKLNWVERRRTKIRTEIERNRRGDYRVPTWVLAVALAVVVAGWILLIALN